MTTIHPDTLREIAADAGEEAVHFSTSYAYRDLMKAFEAYLNRSATRDVLDVASEMEHLQRRVGRLLES
jgi:hypothetical protein